MMEKIIFVLSMNLIMEGKSTAIFTLKCLKTFQWLMVIQKSPFLKCITTQYWFCFGVGVWCGDRVEGLLGEERTNYIPSYLPCTYRDLVLTIYIRKCGYHLVFQYWHPGGTLCCLICDPSWTMMVHLVSAGMCSLISFGS